MQLKYIKINEISEYNTNDSFISTLYELYDGNWIIHIIGNDIQTNNKRTLNIMISYDKLIFNDFINYSKSNTDGNTEETIRHYFDNSKNKDLYETIYSIFHIKKKTIAC